MSDKPSTVEEARKQSRCRICGEHLHPGSGAPANYWQEFKELVWPQGITLNFGGEYAHTKCVKSHREEHP